MSALPDFVVEFSRPLRTDLPRLMIDPRSYLADRIVPDLQLSVIPSRNEGASTARFVAAASAQETVSYVPRRQRLKFSSHQKHVLSEGTYAVDLRVYGLGNWAHALCKGVPLTLKITEELQKRGQPAPRVVVGESLNDKIRTFYERLGFLLVQTDRAVVSPLIRFEERGHVLQGLHGLAHSFLKPHLDRICDDVLQPVPTTGEKIFLNRKDTRKITNNNEIVSLLEAKGFRTVYAEDWSLDEQFRMILRAKEIVAIHGAALAPLLYRRPQDGDLKFVEIFPPGHVVPFYLHMTYRLPCRYIGVRGALDKAMLPELYTQEPHKIDFTQKHSLRPFYLDPESIELALSPDKLRERFGDVTGVWPLSGDT